MLNKKMTIVIAISAILFLLLSYAGMRKVVVPWMTKDYVQEQVEKAVASKDSRIKELNRNLAALGKQLDASKKRYNNLRWMIQQKIDEAKSIEEPETRDETLKRFDSLGYPPQP